VFREADYLGEKVHALCAGLSRRLDEFVEAFPDDAPTKLASLVRAFIEEIEASLATTTNPRIHRHFCLLVELLSEALDWLDNGNRLLKAVLT
jgi:hypothetical protein